MNIPSINELEQELLEYNKLCMYGHIGIEKKRKIQESLQPIVLHIPAEKTEKILCREWKERIREKRNIPLGLNTMKDIVKFLLSEGETVFIDELQNAENVNPDFIMALKEYIHSFKDAKVIVTCSNIAEAKNILKSRKGGRSWEFDKILLLSEPSHKEIFGIMKNLGYNLKDSFIMWGVFGGHLKYYRLLEKSKSSVIDLVKFSFFATPYPLVSEVELMLKEKLGKEYRNYFSVLEAISKGKRTLGEIAYYVGVRNTTVSKYVSSLVNEHMLVHAEKDVFGKGNRRYFISDNLVDFWFHFVWKNISKYETEEVEFSENEFDKYIERKFKETMKKDIERELDKGEKVGFIWHESDSEGKFLFVKRDRWNITLYDVMWGNPKVGDINERLEKLKKIGRQIMQQRKIKIVLYQLLINKPPYLFYSLWPESSDAPDDTRRSPVFIMFGGSTS